MVRAAGVPGLSQMSNPHRQPSDALAQHTWTAAVGKKQNKTEQTAQRPQKTNLSK